MDGQDGAPGAWRTLAARGPLLVVAVLLVAALLAWVGNNWDPEQFGRNLQALVPGDPPAEDLREPAGGRAAAGPDRSAMARAIEGDVPAPAGSVPLEPLVPPPSGAAASESPAPDGVVSVQSPPPQAAAERPPALRGLLADAVGPRRSTAEAPQDPQPEPRHEPSAVDREPPERALVRTDTAEAPTVRRPPVEPRVRPPAPTVPPDVLQAGRLLDAFSSHYADGDLAALTALFSPTANAGTGGVPALRREYAALFRASRRRSLLVTGVQWRPRGEALVGEGRFFARLTRRDGSEGVATGSLQVVVEHGPRGPRIAELHHREGG